MHNFFFKENEKKVNIKDINNKLGLNQTFISLVPLYDKEIGVMSRKSILRPRRGFVVLNWNTFLL